MSTHGSDLYIFQADVTGAFKVGRSGDVQRRLREVQTGCPYKLRMVLHLPGQGHRERDLHRRLAPDRMQLIRLGTGDTKGEWFPYESLSQLPEELYEQLDLDEVDTWWDKR